MDHHRTRATWDGKRSWALVLIVGSLTSASAQAQDKNQTLAELLEVGFQNQPALRAARASLAAAESGRYGLDTLPVFARFVSPDLPIRKEQACLGIAIATAGLRQAEWETRYAITRNFYSIQYARAQKDVVSNLLKTLDAAKKRAEQLVKAGDPDIKVTQLDVDLLALNLEFVGTKEAEAKSGILKATAALREAMGVGLDYPLNVVKADLPGLVTSLKKEELVAMALSNRGEMEQAQAAFQVTDLEVNAQSRLCCKPIANTFAAASDVHAKEIPQGVSNDTYRPGAIGLEMPPNLVGNRRARVQRAQDLSDRAGAVVDKTHNLISLEVEATFLKWQEAAEKVNKLKNTPAMGKSISDRVQKSFNEGKASGKELLEARTLEDQAQAQLNEARYLHALALAALERATAGGYRMPAGK